LIPNVEDPQAKDAQTICPGYKASNVEHTKYGFTATLNLAGEACNVYGTDVDVLNLTVAYQSAHRLAVEITPAHITSENASWYILPSDQVYKPEQGVPDEATEDIDLQFVWSNDPTFYSPLRAAYSSSRISSLNSYPNYPKTTTCMVWERDFTDSDSATI
jgi:alpha-glucosidase